MAGHRCRVAIAVAPSRAWSFVARHENWAELFPGYQGHRPTGPGRSRWTVKGDLGMFSRVMELEVQVVAERCPERVDFIVEGVSEPVTARGAFVLAAPGGAGSELGLEVEIHARGPMAPMIDALLKRRLPAMVDGFARALARRLEERAAGEAPAGIEDDADWRARLERAIRRRYGEDARVDDVVVPTLGGSSRTVLFDVVEGATRRRLASRQESYVGDLSPYLPCAAQYRLLQLAHAHQVPVPEPVFEYEPADDLGQGYVTAFVEGETLPSRILKRPDLAAARGRLVAQYGEALARLHAIDPSHVRFLETTPDSLYALGAQRERLDAYGEDHPALELGLRWLERHRPAAPERRLVHGDFRTGNVIVGPEGLRAVLDWECSHLGSPAEDLGWVCTRSWRFGRPELPAGGLGSREDLVAAYAAAGGARVERDDLRYWEVFGLVRWAVLNVMQAHGHVFGGRRSLVWAACGRNVSTIEYDLLMTLAGHLD